jgi:cytochrome c biogenesis factor
MTANPSIEAEAGRTRQLVASATTGLFAAMMALSGVLYIAGVEKVQDGMHLLGYPDYFTRFLWVAKLLGAAAALVYCVVSNRRLCSGLAILATVALAVLAVRLLGLALDGPGPFTLRVLGPEIALVALAGAALIVERRRLLNEPHPS